MSDQFRKTSLTRRVALGGMAGVLTTAITGFPSVLRAQTKTMTVPNGGGAWEDAARIAFFDTFTQKTGITILSAPSMDNARIKAMVDNNSVDVDVLNVDAARAAAMARSGLLEPIDYTRLPVADIMPEAMKETYVMVDVAAYVAAWNTSAVSDKERPKNWADLFDPAKRWQRGFYKRGVMTLEAAALGGGQPMESLYPLDLDLIFATLDRIRDRTMFWDTGAQSAQLLISGETEVGATWNGRVFQPIKDGAPVDFTFDQAIYTCDSMIIPKGAKNKDLAMEFIANMLDPVNQAKFSSLIPYGPVNSVAFQYLSAENQARLPNSQANSSTAMMLDFDYWADQGPAIIERFNNWLVR